MSEHKNGCIKWPVALPIVLALSGFLAGSYAYTANRVEAVRLEVKEDFREFRKEWRESQEQIIREIRRVNQTRP